MARTLDDFKQLTTEKVRRSKKLQGEIIGRISAMYNRSWSLVEQKRQVFTEWQLLLTKPQTFRTDYIKIYTALQQRKAFIATFKDAEFSVSFSGRETFADDEKARKLNEAAKYDYEAMGKNNKDYFWLSNIFDYGVGIRIQTGYDKLKKVPLWNVVNPESWLPDPMGNSVENNFEYHMFQKVSTLTQLNGVNKSTPDSYFNLDKVDTSSLVDDDGRFEQKQQHRLLSGDVWGSRLVNILDVYMTINGIKYLITLTNQRNNIIRFIPIPAGSSEERKNPYLIPFPVNITNIAPLFEDPYGFAPLEGIIDKQGAQNRLMNLAIIQEQQHVFRKYIVDTDAISNVNLLAKPADRGDIFIPATKSIRDNIGQAIVPVGDHVGADPSKVNLSDRVDQLIQEQTGFTDLNRGVGVSGQTATETKIATINSNLLFSLDSSRLALGERDFWLNIRYRSLQMFLSSAESKLIRIGSGLVGRNIELTRNDLLSGIDPDIEVISMRIKRDKNRQLANIMLQQQGIMLQNPATPQVSKNIFMRRALTLQGISEEEAIIYVPLTADERRALSYLELLNADIVPENLMQPGMDMLTYRVYLSRAEETSAKNKVMAAIENALMQTGQGGVQQQGQGQEGAGLEGLVNSVTSQQTAGMIADNRQAGGVPSIQGGI